MKKFTNFNFDNSRMDREWTEVGSRMDRSTLATMCRYIAVMVMVFGLGIGKIWAVDITIDRFALNDGTIIPINTTSMMCQDEIEFSLNETPSLSSNALSISANKTVTISAHGKTITSISIVWNNAGNAATTANVGTITGWTNSNKTMAWSGSSTSVAFTTTIANRINSVVVTYTDVSPLSGISSTELTSFIKVHNANNIHVLYESKSPSAPGVNINGSFDSNVKLNYSTSTNSLSTNALHIVSPRAISSIVYTWSTAPTATAVTSGTYNSATSTWNAANTSTTEVTLYNSGSAKAVFTKIVINFVSSGCSDWGLYYGTDGQSDWDHECFTQVGSSTEWQVENFVIPNKPNWYVDNAAGNDAKKTLSTWANLYFAASQGDGTRPMVGAAIGAVGTVRIYDDNSWNNRYAGFIPNGYKLKFGSSTYGAMEADGSVANCYWSPLMTYSSSTAGDLVSVGIVDASGDYVASNNTEGMRHIFLHVGNTSTLWGKDSWSNFGLYDNTHTQFTCLMTKVPGETCLYEGWVPSTCTQVIFVRLKSSTPAWGDNNSNITDQTGCWTIPANTNMFTISSFSSGSWSAYEKSGQFRMWDNSTEKNWYVHFYPHNVLTYDGNGETSGSVDVQSVKVDAVSKTVKVAANGFTREGWTFTGWNTEKHGKGSAYAAGDDIDVTEDIKLYAQWERTVYLKSDLSWWYNKNGDDDAWFSIYYWDSDDYTENGKGWVEMEVADACEPTVYKATLPGNGFNYLIFVRKTSDTDLDWDNVDNQSVDVAYPTTNPKYTITSTSDSKVTGTWGTYSAPSQYTITFNAGTGSGSMSAINNICSGADQALTANSFTAPTGYEFDAWHANVDVTVSSATVSAGNDIADEATLQSVGSDITLTAQWTPKTYTITLDRNGGSGDNQVITATYGSSTLSAEVTTPTRDGYYFRGWYNAAGGTGYQVINTSGTLNASVTGFTNASSEWIYTTTSSLTLVARWTQCSAYSFTYGTHGQNDWTSACFTQVGETNEWNITDFTIPNKPNFYVGWTEDFVTTNLGNNGSWSVERAWADVPSQSDSKWQGQIVLLPTASSAVGQATGAVGKLVIWDNSANGNLYVGFKPNGYGLTYAAGTIAFNNWGSTFCETDVVTLTSSDASGNFQVKLATSDSYVACAHGTAENASAVNGRKITGDVDIANGKKGVFQMWTDAAANNFGLRFVTVHDVSFDMQSHGDAIADYTNVRYNDKIVAPSAPTASGYTFGGWYKEPGCTNEWDFANDVVTEATTLYAKWTADGYTVTYKANGGTGDDVVVDPATTIASNSFTAPATMAFVGWNTESDGTGTPYAVGDAVDDNLTLYAQWQYKILYLTTASTSGDDLYDALKDDYVITVRKPKRAASFDYNDTIALIVLHESVKGDSAKNDVATKEVYQLRTANVPVLNTKSYTYGSGRWAWGSPNQGKQPKCIYVKNDTYANLTSHPIFADLTPDGSDSIQILSSISSDNKPIQPVGSFTSGKEGYTLALVPNYESGSGAAIHELSATQRGTGASGQYLLISVFEKDLKNLNANGVKLFQNAAKYLISGSAWVPQYKITHSEASNGSYTIKVGDASAVSTNTTSAAGTTITLAATPSSGYELDSWTVTGDVSSGSVTVTSNTFTMPAEAVTVAATFVEGCTKPGTPTRPTIEDGTLTHAGATFAWDPDGATANSDGYNVSIVKVSDGSTVLSWTSEGIGTEGGAAVYTATGLSDVTTYHFVVRALGAEGYCEYGDTSRLTFTTLGTPYTITYHLNGASWINEGAATYRYGTGYTLPVAGDMTNTGYTFGGWKDNSGLTGSSVTTIGTSDYGNKEYWAKWTENTYTVTYDKNGGTGDAMSNTVGHYVTLSANTYTKSGYIFAGWNTATDGSGASYSEGEEIELKANLDLYAIWATDYTITWDAKAKLSGVAVTPNLGGGNYTITASVATWTGTLTTSMISTETSGVTITNVEVDNIASPKTITATFNVGASVVGDKISFTLDVPANGSYSAKSDTEDFDIDRCTGSSSGSDGVLFSAEFKDSGLGSSDICTAANTPYTFTTAELKAAPTGGSIKASTTSTLSHMKFATNAISIAGSDGVIRIDLDNAIATNDLFTYVNVNSSSSAAYLRHTSPTTTTDQIALTVYNSKEAKVRLTSGFSGKTTLYIVRNNNDFKLHKAAVVRPAFLMLLRDDTPTSDTNLSGTDQGLTTENYLAVISGGSATFTSPTSGNLKIKRNNSKNYINFNSTAGYVKIELNDALQEGDVIGFDSYNTNNLALTTTATRSTSIVTTNQLYTVGASSDLKGKSTFYLWQNSGSSDFLRGLQIARSGVAGGGGGTDKITTTLTWDTDLSGGVAAETGDADFTHSVTQDKNSLGAITYSSSNTSVATVNASGKVHIAGAGNATITATMAASGCYKEATVSYNITVTDNCADVAGTISTEDLGCSGVRLTVTGHTKSGETVSYQWYKDGVSLGSVTGAQTASYTATTAGEYYVVVTNTGDGHCEKASTNTITLEDSEAATATKIVNEWYVKNGRRTPDIALVQTENATDFTVTSGGSPITTFAGCAFYLGTDGIIYLKGQQEDGSAPTGLTSGDETLKFTATACGGNSSELSITIHKQESTTRPSVAFVVDGTKEGAFDAEEENHSVNTELYQYLDYGADETGAFDLTGQNVYSTVDEQAIREHYSQFDAILITDDPSTDTKIGKKSCVNAFGTMIDVRPILTMEAFVSKWGNWKAKGIDGNPESPNPRQYKMKLQCKDHAIFKDLSVGTNVETETIGGVEYWTVTMVDSTKSPYSGVADGTDTDTKPALQGFSADDVNSLLLLGQISGGSLYAGVERQEETAARLMLLGLNAKALPNALTPEGKKVIENALKYLIETDLEKVDDCSNYFTGKTSTDWNTDSNWSKNHVPNSPNVRVRILSECVIYSGTYKVAEVDIATSGKSLNKAGEMTGKLTINAGAALIVGGKIRTAEAPYFNTGDLKPTTEEDLVINTSSTAQAALIFNNDAGDTKATVNLYSLGCHNGTNYQFQYFAVPMTYIDVNPAFAGSGIYTYVWNEASGWERRGYYVGLEAFEGVGITTKFADARTYQMKGTLASTATKEITLTHEDKGHNLIGNSWTAPIQISQLEEDNSSMSNKTVYIYNTGNDATAAGGYGTGAGQWTAIPFNAADFRAWDGLKVIPAMQAFEIVPTEEETLTLDYEKVVRGDNKSLTEPLRAPKASHEGIELMRIRVAESNAHADLYLFEGSTFSDEFDNGWEAAFMDGDGPSAQLYANVALGRMAVVATDELEGTFLGFVPGQETTYTFSFGGAGMGYYLNDLKLMTSTLINEEATYSFTFEEGDANRFYISRTPIEAPQTPTGVDNTHSGEVKAQKFIYNDKMYIMINGRVYSAEGQIVK